MSNETDILTPEEKEAWAKLQEEEKVADPEGDENAFRMPEADERLFLSTMLQDEVFATYAADKINSVFFSEKNQKIAQINFEYLKKYSCLPSFSVWLSLIEEKFNSDKKMEATSILNSLLVSSCVGDRQYVIDKFDYWNNTKSVKQMFATFCKDFNNPRTKAEAVKQAIAQLQKLTEDKNIKLPTSGHFGDKRSNDSVKPPIPIIEGLADKESQLLLGGASKSYKTWTLMHLALAVANGVEWLGQKCKQGKVLYLNFELTEWYCRKRFLEIEEAMGLKDSTLTNENLITWDLKGHAASYKQIFPIIEKEILNEPVDMIIIDPVYKIQDGDENSNADVKDFMNALESIAVQSGALLVMAAHFSKGNASKKIDMDRVSGAGVFARAPDAMIYFTEGQDPDNASKDCFLVDMKNRNYPPIPQFVVKWEFPLWRRKSEIDPADVIMKTATKWSADACLSGLADGMSIGQWEKSVGCAKNTLYKYKMELIDKGLVVFDAKDAKYYHAK